MNIRDSVTKGLGRSLSIVKNKPNFKALQEVSLKQVKELEDAIFDLIDHLSINEATGDLLNKIGAMVGAYRNGRSDPDFRDEIFLNIAINTSDGTHNKLINIIRLLTKSTNVSIQRDFPAGLIVTVDGANVTPTMASKIQRAVAAGVSLTLNGTNGKNPLGLVSGSTGQNGVTGAKGLYDDGLDLEEAGYLVDGFPNTGINSPTLEGYVNAAETYATPQLTADAIVEVYNNPSQYTPIFNARLAVVIAAFNPTDAVDYQTIAFNYLLLWGLQGETEEDFNKAKPVIDSLPTSLDKIRYLTLLGVY